MNGRKWISLLAVLPFLCVAGPAAAEEVESLVQLTADDFPCDTVPPKCPDVPGFFLGQLNKLFPNDVMDISLDERIDIDQGICDELYVQVGGSLTLPTEGIEAIAYMDREGEWNDHLGVEMGLWYLNFEASLTVVARDCLGFLGIDFTIPFDTHLWADHIVWNARYGVWYDNVANQVQLSDEYSEVGIDVFYFEALPEPWNTFLNATGIPLLLTRDLLDNLLISENGLVFNLAEGMMDGLYKTQPCGCMMVPAGHYADPGMIRGHIALNMLPYLLPLGLVGWLRRRAKK